ncbi:PREDICTED: nuclear factor erythroid 2-related factor 1-like, partial [Cyprinodon variegatus]|uniref:nuclear factor erythroid 2-related factor 1-like n=1 Tax=Cyprinodon variegatus TaxID=28743 RepID=UPI00074254FB
INGVEISDEGEQQSSGTEPTPPSALPENQPLVLDVDLETQWRDLMDILEPQNIGVEMMTALNHTPDGPDAPPPGRAGPVGHQMDPLTGSAVLLHGIPDQLEQKPVLLPLTPSDELDDSSLELSALGNYSRNSWFDPPTYSHLLPQNPVEDFSKGTHANVDATAFSMELLAPDVPSFSSDLTNGYSRASERNDLNQQLDFASFSVLDEIEADSLSGQISNFLEDFNILEDMSLLDEALGEGFSPDMEARLKAEGYLQSEGADRGSATGWNWMEDQRQPDAHKDCRVETDSDSGLCLDSIHSPSSPSVSEGSADYSSCASAVEQVRSEEDRSDTEGLAGSELEVEVTIKQEELEDEEMGAAGGVIPVNHADHKLFQGFSWLEHVGHDYTFINSPLSSSSSPARSRKLSAQTKTAGRRRRARPYQACSSRPLPGGKIWNRDEQRARALRIPFSYELIVNLPVDEFNLLLTSYPLSKEQLTLVRDIRRRGKNKVAAQNCRQRKQDVLLTLEEDLRALRRHHSQLLQENQNRLSLLQDVKNRYGLLYQEIFTKLMDAEGRPLNAKEYMLQFGPDDTVTVAPLRGNRNSKKHRDVKKRRS